MNCRERFNSAVRSEEADRTPTFLFDLSLGMDVLDVNTTDVFRDGKFNGKLGGRSVLALQEFLGQDAVAGSYQSVDVTAFGGTMAYPERGIPYMTRPPFKEPMHLYECSVDDMRIDDIAESYSTIRSSRPDIGLMMNIPAPMSMAMVFRGLEPMLMDLYLEPKYANDVIEFGGAVSRRSVEAISNEAEIDGVLLTAAYDNLDMVGKKALEEFSFDGLARSIDHIHDLDLPVMFHPHGALTVDGTSESVLDDMIDMGIDCMYYGETIDPVKMLEHTRGICSVAGGIDTFSTIYLGPDERVRDDVSAYLSNFNDDDYIFSCSCSLDRGLSLKRLKIMMDAVQISLSRTF